MARPKELAFVLTRSTGMPSAIDIIGYAAELGIRLDDRTAREFAIAQRGSLLISHARVPYPDADSKPTGLLSPSAEQLGTATSHLMLVGFDLRGSAPERDALMYRLTAAVVRATDAVAVVNHGANVFRSDVFASLAELAVDQASIPVELSISITATSSGQRTVLLTQGMARFGREELCVTCSPTGRGGYQFVYDIARWMLAEPRPRVLTGETIGRTSDERIVVQRIRHPAQPKLTVIKLDLVD